MLEFFSLGIFFGNYVPAFTGQNSTMKTPEQYVKYVQL